MNFLSQYMGQYGPSMGWDNYDQPQLRQRPWMQQGYQGNYHPDMQTGGALPPQAMQAPNFGAGNAGKGLAGIYGQHGPDNSVMPLPAMGTGGNDPAHAMQGGFQQQRHNGGLAGMFRGFSPYGRQYMR